MSRPRTRTKDLRERLRLFLSKTKSSNERTTRPRVSAREPLVLNARPGSDRAPASRDKTVDEQHDDGADDSADQARTLARPIPSERMAEITGDEGADDS